MQVEGRAESSSEEEEDEENADAAAAAAATATADGAEVVATDDAIPTGRGQNGSGPAGTHLSQPDYIVAHTHYSAMPPLSLSLLDICWAVRPTQWLITRVISMANRLLGRKSARARGGMHLTC